MSTVIATSVLPDSTANKTLTFGATGDSVAVSGDSLNMNTLQDAGGNTIFVSDGSGTITSTNTGFTGALIHVSSQTASGSASLSFTTGIDSTYDVYIFKFYDVNPATESTKFGFQANAVGGSGFNETMTTTFFLSYHNEAGSSSGLIYYDVEDQAQGTGYQTLAYNFGAGADECAVGELYLFAPSSTTYVKHFYARINEYHESDYSQDQYIGGYINTTAAIDEIDFKMSSGNFDGTIAMYGISKS